MDLLASLSVTCRGGLTGPEMALVCCASKDETIVLLQAAGQGCNLQWANMAIHNDRLVLDRLVVEKMCYWCQQYDNIRANG